MAITSAIVLYAVIWFMLLLIALPMRMTSQEEDGEVVPGTPSSAPIDPKMKKKFIWVTVISFVLWGPLCLFILSGYWTIEDIDIWGVMSR